VWPSISSHHLSINIFIYSYIKFTLKANSSSWYWLDVYNIHFLQRFFLCEGIQHSVISPKTFHHLFFTMYYFFLLIPLCSLPSNRCFFLIPLLRFEAPDDVSVSRTPSTHAPDIPPPPLTSPLFASSRGLRNWMKIIKSKWKRLCKFLTRMCVYAVWLFSRVFVCVCVAVYILSRYAPFDRK